MKPRDIRKDLLGWMSSGSVAKELSSLISLMIFLLLNLGTLHILVGTDLETEKSSQMLMGEFYLHRQ